MDGKTVRYTLLAAGFGLFATSALAQGPLTITLSQDMTLDNGTTLLPEDFIGFDVYLQRDDIGYDRKFFSPGWTVTIPNLEPGDYQVQLVPWSAPGCAGEPSETATITVVSTEPTVANFTYTTETAKPPEDPAQNCADDPDCDVVQ